jgi:hypothetical protein
MVSLGAYAYVFGAMKSLIPPPFGPMDSRTVPLTPLTRTSGPSPEDGQIPHAPSKGIPVVTRRATISHTERAPEARSRSIELNLGIPDQAAARFLRDGNRGGTNMLAPTPLTDANAQRLPLSPHALEWLPVGLHIHDAAGLIVSLGRKARRRAELRPAFDRPDSLT